MQFLLISCYSVPLTPNVSFLALFSHTLNLYSSLNVKQHISHTHKTRGKISSSHFNLHIFRQQTGRQQICSDSLFQLHIIIATLQSTVTRLSKCASFSRNAPFKQLRHSIKLVTTQLNVTANRQCVNSEYKIILHMISFSSQCHQCLQNPAVSSPELCKPSGTLSYLFTSNLQPQKPALSRHTKLSHCQMGSSVQQALIWG